MEIAVKVIKKNRKNESIPVLPAIPQRGIGSYFFRGKALAWKPCLSTLQLGFRCHDQIRKTDALSLQGLPGTFRRPHGYRAFQKHTSSPQMAHGYLPAAHRPKGHIKHSDSKGIRHHSKDGMVPQSSHPRGHETARGIIRRGSRG